MWSCNQSLTTLAIREFTATSIFYKFHQENLFFEGCSWIKFNNLEVALGMALNFLHHCGKRFKLKVKSLQVLVAKMFVVVT